MAGEGKKDRGKERYKQEVWKWGQEKPETGGRERE